jgi:hypothetical protein
MGAGIAQSVQRLATGLMTVRSEFEFPLLHVAQPGSGAHPPSYSIGTGHSIPGVKCGEGRETEHSPPTSAEIKNTLIYISSPPYAFMV